MRRGKELLLGVFATGLLVGCGGAVDQTSIGGEGAAIGSTTPFGPDFSFHEVRDDDLRAFFAKQITVFGVPIVGTGTLADHKMVHAAHMMAQYLDNDEDGSVDDPNVLIAMLERNALLVMFANFEELEASGLFEADDIRDRYEIQDLEGHETVASVDRVEGNADDRFDAAIEEVWHLVSYAGYAAAYPDAFGQNPGSRLADAMDLARGGRFMKIPDPYPSGAWYTYDDETCDYGCMAIEYIYWALSTHLGAQSDPERCEWMSREWRACTAEQLAEIDPAVTALLTDPQYSVPTVLPDGSYGE